MADFDALMKGMSLFNDGMKKLATTRAVNQAQDELSSLETAELEDAAKRKQQQLVAQNLVLNLTKAGADPSAASALMPRPLTQTDTFIEQSRQDDLNERKAGRDFQAKENALNRAAQREALGLKQNPKMKQLTDKHVDEISAFDDDFAIGSSLVKELNQKPYLVGTAAGRIPGRGIVDPTFASFSQATQAWFDTYRKNITGAGASEGELAKLEQNRPTVKDSLTQFKAKVDRIIQVGQGIRQRKLKNLERAGRDVSRFDMESSGEMPAAVSETPPAPEAEAATTPVPQAQSRFLKHIIRK